MKPVRLPARPTSYRHTALLTVAALFAMLAAPQLRPQAAPAAPPLAPAPSIAIPAPVFLYPGGAPGALGHAEADRPRFYPFLPATRSSKAAVLIIPGGGYYAVALGHEGIQYAQWLNAQGIAAFVLDYRVAPYAFPVEIQDGAQAMRLIRAHAADYGIDPDRIGVWGSSAGGHLAATLATQCHVSDAPGSGLSGLGCEANFAILSYPVISMEAPIAHAGSVTNLLGPNPTPAQLHQLSPQYAVTSATPPTFLFATTGDPVVPVANSVAMYSALQTAQVPVEMHLFDYSNHGCGLCGDIPELAGWPLLLRAWMTHHSLIPPSAPPPPPPAANMPDWPAGIDGPGHKS
ncbi:alpha/beta hydrolase [Acidipila sp. EB88]|uniref:alpha/beta hydrolase n=1 Tax=Acidipila sp. EB88 TaxID=2305226 RepID=UPI000F5EB4B8|nr:alpha/beta hydrolase [Acidipila sp. EB88]RRA48336.1 alpha/beta hydrolase [Acidipila sp. EB88]